MKFITLVATSLLLLALTQSVRAQLPAARLSSVFPPGGQQGTNVEVIVAGTDLDDLTSLHFATPGILAEPKRDPATGNAVPNTFVVRIDRNVRPGAYDVTAAGRFGVTNPRAFGVDREPQAVSKADNVTAAAAQEMAVNTGVYAVAGENASRFYRVHLKANQRVFIEADAAAIDSRMDPVVVLYDASGRELAQDLRGDSLDFTPPADGDYVVEVHDVLYRGGGENFYRLRVSDGPKVAFVLPPATHPDGLSTATVFGHKLPNGTILPGNPTLDGRPLESLTLNLQDANEDDLAALTPRWLLNASAAMLDGSQRYRFAGGINPLFLANTAAPLVAEQADNNEPGKAQKITPPAEVFGQFFPRGDRDWISFDAKKGEAFWIEMVSNRLANTTDPMAVIQRVTKNEKGEEQVADVKESSDPENLPAMPREFNGAHRDPAFQFQAPEDGTYRVMTRDLFNEGADDPSRVYRLSIAPARECEDFRLIAWPQSPQALLPEPPTTQVWGSNLRPGGVMPIRVLAIRSGGFGGEIVLCAEDLPPGVTCKPVTMNSAASQATLLLAADEKAMPYVGAIRVVGRSKSGESVSTRTARPGTVVWGVADPENQALRSRVTQRLMLAVTAGEPDPITIAPVEEKLWEESVAGRLEIPLKATRRMGFNGPIKVKPGGTPKFVEIPEFEIPANTADGKLVVDIGVLALPPGNYSLYLQATSIAPYNRYPAQLTAAQNAKAAADKATADLAAQLQKAKEALEAVKKAANAEAIATAEKAVAAEDAKVKQNEATKVATAEQIKALTPKDVTAFGYSTPISVKITPAPITLAVTAPASPVKPGAKVDIPVTLARLYNFAQPVELSLVMPQGVTGFVAPNIAIAAGATQGVVSLQVAPEVKPGEYTLNLVVTLKQNDRPVKIEQSVRVVVG